MWPIGVATVAALALLCFWTVRPVFTPVGFGRYDTMALIRHAFPIRLVEPQWIADQSNLYFLWSIAEARARFVLSVTLWVAACGAIIYFRARDSRLRVRRV